MEVQGGGEAPAPGTEEAAMKAPSKEKMLARRARKGYNPAESPARLEEIVSGEYGKWAQVSCLVYEGFATENGALALVGEQEG